MPRVYNLDEVSDDGDLTVGEVIERLKKDPNDPDPRVQEFKKITEEFAESFAPSAAQLQRISATVSEAFQSIQPTLNLYNSQYEQIKESLLRTANAFESIRANLIKVSEPTMAIIDSFAKLKTPLIYPTLFESTVEFDTTSFEEKIEKTDNYVEEIRHEVTDLGVEVERLQKDEPKFMHGLYASDEKTGSFVLKTVKYLTLNLTSETGKDDMKNLFFACLDILEECGENAGNFFQVVITKAKLIEKLRMRGMSEVTGRWITFTKSNIVNKKVRISGLEFDIVITDYDPLINGFYFKLKLSQQL